MNLKLEYIILIILALMFYFYSLKYGSRIITESKIIGEVLEINKNECLIITGTEEKNSYLLIKLNSIESIIEA